MEIQGFLGKKLLPLAGSGEVKTFHTPATVQSSLDPKDTGGRDADTRRFKLAVAVRLCSEASVLDRPQRGGSHAAGRSSVRAQRTLRRRLSGEALPPQEACASVLVAAGRVLRAGPTSGPLPTGLPLIRRSRGLALFAFCDPAPAPSPPPPALGLGGLRAGLLSLGTSGRLCLRSCSAQNDRPSWVEPKAVPSWWSLQKELGQKWQNEVEGLPHTSQ